MPRASGVRRWVSATSEDKSVCARRRVIRHDRMSPAARGHVHPRIRPARARRCASGPSGWRAACLFYYRARRLSAARRPKWSESAESTPHSVHQSEGMSVAASASKGQGGTRYFARTRYTTSPHPRSRLGQNGVIPPEEGGIRHSRPPSRYGTRRELRRGSSLARC